MLIPAAAVTQPIVGGPACDVSGEGSAGREGQPGMRLGFCKVEVMETTWMHSIPFLGIRHSKQIANAANANGLDAVVQTNSSFPRDAPQDQHGGF